MLLNQQHAITTDASNFALFVQRHNHGPSKQNFKGKSRLTSPGRFSPRPIHSKGSTSIGHSAPPQQQSSLSRGFSFQPPTRVPCQICGKTSHQALDCFHRMDHSYQGRHPPAQLAAMVAHNNSSHENQPWFVDSGANSHITSELGNLTI